jgi:hypothetical protein
MPVARAAEQRALSLSAHRSVPMKPPTPSASWLASMRAATRALRHRNYQLFFFGQGTSLIGTWMQRVALGWLVHPVYVSKGVVPAPDSPGTGQPAPPEHLML